MERQFAKTAKMNKRTTNIEVSSIDHDAEYVNEIPEHSSIDAYNTHAYQSVADNQSFTFPNEMTQATDAVKQMRATQKLPRLNKMKKQKVLGVSD